MWHWISSICLSRSTPPFALCAKVWPYQWFLCPARFNQWVPWQVMGGQEENEIGVVIPWLLPCSHFRLFVALNWRQSSVRCPSLVYCNHSFSHSFRPRSSNSHTMSVLSHVVPLYPFHTFVNLSLFKLSWDHLNFSVPGTLTDTHGYVGGIGTLT